MIFQTARWWQRHADIVLFLAIFALMSLHWLTGFKALPWDAMDEFFPVSRFIADSILDGQWPWWNPYQYSGTPVFADPQSLLFTVFTVVGVMLGQHFTPTIFGAITLLHLAAGGGALVVYARCFDASLLQRVVAALVFALAGVASARLQHVPQIVTYGYLPIALCAGYFWIVRLRWPQFVGLSVVIVLIALNPNQVTLLGGFVVGVLLLAHVAMRSNKRVVALLGLTGAAIMGVAAASPLLLAVAEYSQLSSRTALTLADSQAASLPAFALGALAFPGLFGIGGWAKATWMPNDISENWLYLGGGAVLIAALGLRSRQTRIWGVVAALFIFFSLYVLGVNTPIYPWLYANVAGFSLFRRPSDGAYSLMLLASVALVHQSLPAHFNRKRLFCAALLTGVCIAFFIAISGATDFANSKAQSGNFNVNALWVIVRLALLVALFAYVQHHWQARWTSEPRAVCLLAVCIAIEMCAPARFREFLGNSRSWAAGQIYRGVGDTSEARELQDLIKRLKLGGAGGDAAQFRFETVAPPLGLAMPSVVKVSNTQGYSPMRIGAYHRIIGAPEPWEARGFTPIAPSYADAWFRAISLRYVVLENGAKSAPERGPAFRRVAELKQRDLQSFLPHPIATLAGYEVWELPAPNPAISLVSGETLQQPTPATHDRARGRCDLLKRDSASVLARCSVTVDSMAVFSEIAFPGWYACVGGMSAEIQTAWGLLRGVPLAKGNHWVSLHFEPVPFWRQRRCESR